MVCWSRVPEAQYRMKFFNADGSSAEMCGNGIRCFAKYLVDNDLVSLNQQIPVDTDAGVLFVDVLENSDKEALVRVDMGKPQLENASQFCIKRSSDQSTSVCTIDGREYIYVGIGNPHAVSFSSHPEKDALRLGPSIEVHEYFPKKTNVEFVNILSPNLLEMHVWERGAGITLACGTGACASFVAAKCSGKINGSEAIVRLPGGDLGIVWEGPGQSIFMTGNAVNVNQVPGSHDLFNSFP